VNLSDRLKYYYSNLSLENKLKNSQSYIYNAILKHGLSNFSLAIIEYCEPEQCLDREDFYLSSLRHEYNILEKAGSSLGFRHSDKTKKIMSGAKKGENNPFFGQNHSDETRKKMSEAKTGLQAAFFGKNHSAESRKKISDAKLGQARPGGAGRPSQPISVFDKNTNETTIYDSIRAAARTLNMDSGIISSYLKRNQQKPYKGQYIFKQV